MSPRGSRKSAFRKVFVRLLEFSPLPALALLVGLVLSVPTPLGVSLVNGLASSGALPITSAAELASTTPSEVSQQYFADKGKLYEDFSRAASIFNDRSSPHQNELFDASGRPKRFPWPASSPWFDPVRGFEKRSGARVYVFFTPYPDMPSLIASAVAEPSLMPSRAELSGEQGAAQVPAVPPGMPARIARAYREVMGYMLSHEIPQQLRQPQRSYRDAFEWAWWQDRQGPGHPEFNLSLSGSSARSDAHRSLHAGFALHHAAVYSALSITATELPTGPSTAWDRFVSLEPTHSDFRRRLSALSKAMRGDLFVAGPVKIDIVPVFPATKSADRVAASLRGDEGGSPGPVRASSALTAATGARWVSILTAREAGAQQGVPPTSTDSPGFQNFLFVATWTGDPALAGTSSWPVLERAWLRYRLFVGSNILWLLALGMALYGTSLGASLGAFIYERRHETQDRVLAEMRRVQQDAHDRVYNRLAALSKRVSLTSGELSADVGSRLEGLSEDIRSTLTELQAILGDSDRKASGIAGASGLADQLEQICRAQAARLQMEVAFDVEGALPEVSPQTSWDIQCVVEEALNNASKHGQATKATVNVAAADSMLRVEISDDGRGLPAGFSVDALPETSTGLRGMQLRAERLGGNFVFKRAEPGARVVFEIPIG